MNIYLIDLIDIKICSDSEIYENENTFTASLAKQRKLNISTWSNPKHTDFR